MIGLYGSERYKDCGAAATLIQLADQERVLPRQAIDASAKKLMEAGRGVVLQLDPPGAPQVAPRMVMRLSEVSKKSGAAGASPESLCK